jgi:hypothetical protein
VIHFGIFILEKTKISSSVNDRGFVPVKNAGVKLVNVLKVVGLTMINGTAQMLQTNILD